MQTDNSLPAYVVTAFAIVQQEHLVSFGSELTNMVGPDELDDILRDLAAEEPHFLQRARDKGMNPPNPEFDGDLSSQRWLMSYPQGPSLGAIAIPVPHDYDDFKGDTLPGLTIPDNKDRDMNVLNRQTAIAAQVQADLDRIYGAEEQHPSVEFPAPVSVPRVVTYVIPDSAEVTVLGEGVWEPRKPMISADVYRHAPPAFSLDSVPAVDAVQKPVPKVLDRSLVEWLEMVNSMDVAQAGAEVHSKAGQELVESLKLYLFHTSGVKLAVADELESMGYQVSYNKGTSVLLVEMTSGTIRWTA